MLMALNYFDIFNEFLDLSPAHACRVSCRIFKVCFLRHPRCIFLFLQILEVLRSLYGDDNVSDLEEFYFRRWGTDPFHYGLFTTWPVPAYFSETVTQRLASKVGRVFFAQEAGTGAEGTELAKFAASDAAVEQLLRCVNEGDCEDGFEPAEGGEGGEGGQEGEDEDDDDELYGCVRVLKKEGKTRKVDPEDE